MLVGGLVVAGILVQDTCAIDNGFIDVDADLEHASVALDGRSGAQAVEWCVGWNVGDGDGRHGDVPCKRVELALGGGVLFGLLGAR